MTNIRKHGFNSFLLKSVKCVCKIQSSLFYSDVLRFFNDIYPFLNPLIVVSTAKTTITPVLLLIVIIVIVFHLVMIIVSSCLSRKHYYL